MNAADVEILFEAVELQEIRELERSDISASLTDFPLHIVNDFLELGFTEARLEELKPEPLPIESQAHALAGQTAIQRVSLHRGKRRDETDIFTGLSTRSHVTLANSCEGVNGYFLTALSLRFKITGEADL